MTRIILVDENDIEIGLKERNDIAPEDMYRVSGLWITNSKGEALLARRALSKKKSPGKWGPAAAGTVDEGETYFDNIIKEAEEEIGLLLTPQEISEGPKIHLHGKHRHFVQWYYATVDKPVEEFVLQEDEVMDLKWVPYSELLHLYEHQRDVFIGTIDQWLPQVLKGCE